MVLLINIAYVIVALWVAINTIALAGNWKRIKSGEITVENRIIVPYIALLALIVYSAAIQ